MIRPAAGGTSTGSTQVVGRSVDLTQASTDDQAGTAFWPRPVNAEGLTASFTATIGGGGTQGADGMALVLADPTTSPTAVGYYGGGLGFSGINGIAVCIDTYQEGSGPVVELRGHLQRAGHLDHPRPAELAGHAEPSTRTSGGPTPSR